MLFLFYQVVRTFKQKTGKYIKECATITDLLQTEVQLKNLDRLSWHEPYETSSF